MEEYIAFDSHKHYAWAEHEKVGSVSYQPIGLIRINFRPDHQFTFVSLVHVNMETG